MRWKIFAWLVILAATGFTRNASAQRLAYGPNTCKNGYIFRGAWPNDQVCVAVPTYKQVQQDNRMAASNISPGPFGKDQCRNGLVWRNARPQDHVCVNEQQRRQAATDNYYDYSRKQARLQEPRTKPIAPPSRATGADAEGPVFHPGVEGVTSCSDRYKCPPRMAMAVEGDGCVCKQ